MARNAATRDGSDGAVVRGGRVVDDQVHVEPAGCRGVQQARQLVGLGGRVVDAVEHQVLDEHAPARGLAIALAGLHHGLQRVPAIDRHQRRADRVAGRVQRDRELHLQRLRREAVDARHPPGRGDRDRAGTEPEPGRVVGQPAEGEHLVVVVERLAHAHQHDVGDPPAVAPRLARRPQQLLEDLAAGEVAAEAHGARRAERAREGAARLRRDADRAAVAVPHQHRLEREPVQRAEPRLHRLIGGALLLVEDQLRERQLAGEARADGLRERGHVVPGRRQVARHALPDLFSPIRWLAPVSE